MWGKKVMNLDTSCSIEYMVLNDVKSDSAEGRGDCKKVVHTFISTFRLYCRP